ncbi:MAG: STAS domain-containing protein [Actinomycetota bacterium]
MAPNATTPHAWALHSVTRPDNVVELRPSGPLDASTARFLGARLDALVRSGYDVIIVDFRSVVRIDAAGMAPIQRAAEILEAIGGQLVTADLDDDLAIQFGAPLAAAA